MRNQKCKKSATDTRRFVGTQSKFSILVIVFLSCFFILNSGGRALAESPQTKSMDSLYKALSESVEKGVRGPIGNWHYYQILAEDHGRQPVGESVPLKQMKEIV